MPSSRSRRLSAAQPAPEEGDAVRADDEVTTCAGVGLPATARVLFAVVNANGTLIRGSASPPPTVSPPGCTR